MAKDSGIGESGEMAVL